MKKIINKLSLILGFGILVSCGGGDTLDAKKASLEKLKAQQAEIGSEIKVLEEEILAIGKNELDPVVKEKFVSVTAIQVGTFNHYIDVQGRVDGDQNTTISARAMGPVVKILVNSGAQVKKGQVLAQLDGEIVARQVADLKINLAFVTDVYNKQKALWEKQVGSEVQYLSAKNNKESLEQKLATLYENLDMYSIKSPINGTVDEVFIKIGQNVAPGMPCFRVVNMGDLKAKADVSESYASHIAQGNKVSLYFPDLNNLEVPSTITFASRVISQMNRTFIIEAPIPGGKDFIPNMICVFKVLDYQAKNAIVIPVNTLQKTESSTFVVVASVQNGKKVVVKKEVKTGKYYQDKVEILAGLQAGDLLITSGYQDLNENEVLNY